MNTRSYPTLRAIMGFSSAMIKICHNLFSNVSQYRRLDHAQIDRLLSQFKLL